MERTINEVFQNRAEKYQDRLAVEKKRGGVWESATWNQYYERARLTGLGLYHLGIRKGDRVSLLSENRLEWLYTDMGCMSALQPLMLKVFRPFWRISRKNSRP